MKKLFYLSLALIFLASSCNDDDDQQGPSNSNPNAGDSFLIYDRIDNVSFQMWVGGQEISTSNLDIADYLKEESTDYFSDQVLQNGNVQFEGDTIIVNLSFVPPNSKYLYEFSNDSLYISYPFVGYTFTATGTKQNLQMEQGYFYASRTLNESWLWKWQFETYRMDFDNIEDELYWNEISQMNSMDTLIIYNQTLHYKN